MAHSLPMNGWSNSVEDCVCAALNSQLPLANAFEACYLEYNRILPLETTATHVRVAAWVV